MAARNQIHWKFLLAYTLLALLAAWIFSLAWLSMIYVQNLLNPTCSQHGPAPAGFQAITLETEDGFSLAGWWRPPQNGVVVLLTGGLGANRDSMLDEAMLLVRHGYGAMTLDYRHCSGEISSLGYAEIQEIQAMVSFAAAQPESEHIAVLGFSIGGTAALLAAAETPGIEAVIAQGNYANLKDEITAGDAAPLSLRWQIQQFVLLGFTLRTGIRPAEISPLDAIPDIHPRPILFIHGENEIERTLAMQQFQAAQEHAILWVVPGASHGGYMQAHPNEYEEKVIRFLKDSFQD